MTAAVHAWNYRRYVLANMPVPRTRVSELAYTTRKIEASFSNFSAWHQRSKLLPVMWAAGELDESRSRTDGEMGPFALLSACG
jgi:geranylgeranyl transferase type-2 subunit alpha